MDTADGPVVLLDAVEEAGATPRDGEAARRTRGTSGGAARRPGRAARSGDAAARRRSRRGGEVGRKAGRSGILNCRPGRLSKRFSPPDLIGPKIITVFTTGP